jgi:hypothetical protein
VTRTKSPRFRLTHTGSFYAGKRWSKELLEAVCDLRAAGIIHDDFELRMVGEIPPAIEQFIRDVGAQDIVSWTTPLFYRPSLAEMDAADVLLVVDANFDNSPFLPSKLFDYLMFDSPILGVTPSGSATDKFLQQLGYRTASPSDLEGIKKCIVQLMDEWRSGNLRPTVAHIEARKTYDLHPIAERYIELFNKLCA